MGVVCVWLLVWERIEILPYVFTRGLSQTKWTLVHLGEMVGISGVVVNWLAL